LLWGGTTTPKPNSRTPAPMKGVTVNGKPWTGYHKDNETITLKGLTGQVAVTARY
jgi:hypothetical protein